MKLKYHLCDHCDFTAFSKNISRLHAAKEHGTSDLKSFAAIFKEKSEAERKKEDKYHGKVSSYLIVRPSDLNNRSEDMVCKWLVGGVKNSFKTLGGNFTEETFDRKINSLVSIRIV